MNGNEWKVNLKELWMVIVGNSVKYVWFVNNERKRATPLTRSFNMHLTESLWHEQQFAFLSFFRLVKEIVEGMWKTFQS